MTSQTCFLLSYLKYGDNDAILNCFSQEHGFESFFAAGIYAPKNKKKAYLFPLNQIQISVLHTKNRNTLPRVSRIEQTGFLYEYTEVKINSILFFVSDFLYQVLRNEQHQEKIYAEIGLFLEQLYGKNMDSYVAFIFRLLSLQGISPLCSNESFLNAESGNFSLQQVTGLFDEEVSGVWKTYLSSEDSYTIKLKRNVRQKTLESLMYYYGIHFDGFYEPRSLEIIQQIYD